MPSSDEDKRDLASGQRVLAAEAEALLALSAMLDGRFAEAVRTLRACTGRVIVSGMGKSGHVARKIAATLASTGQPAFFVHPAEASHGDLGMIGRQDCVLVLSNSGETAELRDLVAYTRRFSLPLMVITRDPRSSLAREADLVLQLPSLPEVGALALAPTTSTTMMIALGDSLAVSLLEQRGFSAEDFRNFHPGGRLGQSLLRVGALMHKGDSVPIAPQTLTMDRALKVMTAKGFGCVALVDDDGVLAGIVTDGDLRRHAAPDLLTRQACAIMTRNPMTCTDKTLAAEALGILNDRRRTQLIVVDDGCKPIGLIHIHDLLQAGVM